MRPRGTLISNSDFPQSQTSDRANIPLRHSGKDFPQKQNSGIDCICRLTVALWNKILPDRFSMLSKCANPGCSATFLYLSRGKLFRWEVSVAAKNNGRDSGPNQQVSSASRRLEFFWLCEDCAPAMTLSSSSRGGGHGGPPHPARESGCRRGYFRGGQGRFVG